MFSAERGRHGASLNNPQALVHGVAATEISRFVRRLGIRDFILCSSSSAPEVHAVSELPHLALLMRADFQVRARFPGARQNGSGFSVFGEIGERVELVHFPWALQLCGAGQAEPLMTQCRQGDTGGESRVPDALLNADSAVSEPGLTRLASLDSS
jgi:hypothetical protein